MANTITEQQVHFINVMQAERFVPEAMVKTMRVMWKNGLMTTEAADGFIQSMRLAPTNDKMIARHNMLVGYHMLNNNVFRVYRSKYGNMYVKMLTVKENGALTMTYTDFKVITQLNENTKMNDKAVAHIEQLIFTKVR